MNSYFPKHLGQTCTLMALILGTPLAIAGEPKPTPTPTPVITWETDIQPIIQDNCVFCHSAPEGSGDVILETKEEVLKLKSKIIQVVSEGIMPQGNPDFATSPEGLTLIEWLKAQVTFDADIKPIVDKNCSRCHNPNKMSGGLSFDTEEKIALAQKKIAAAVSSGKMPKDNKTWNTTPEAKIFLEWIASLDAVTPSP